MPRRGEQAPSVRRLWPARHRQDCRRGRAAPAATGDPPLAAHSLLRPLQLGGRRADGSPPPPAPRAAAAAPGGAARLGQPHLRARARLRAYRLRHQAVAPAQRAEPRRRGDAARAAQVRLRQRRDQPVRRAAARAAAAAAADPVHVRGDAHAARERRAVRLLAAWRRPARAARRAARRRRRPAPLHAHHRGRGVAGARAGDAAAPLVCGPALRRAHVRRPQAARPDRPLDLLPRARPRDLDARAAYEAAALRAARGRRLPPPSLLRPSLRHQAGAQLPLARRAALAAVAALLRGRAAGVRRPCDVARHGGVGGAAAARLPAALLRRHVGAHARGGLALLLQPSGGGEGRGAHREAARREQGGRYRHHHQRRCGGDAVSQAGGQGAAAAPLAQAGRGPRRLGRRLPGAGGDDHHHLDGARVIRRPQQPRPARVAAQPHVVAAALQRRHHARPRAARRGGRPERAVRRPVVARAAPVRGRERLLSRLPPPANDGGHRGRGV
mmetsp:Transcript_9664/g.32175  ORF Transcript_9664/g.32175 Transcript_9664/m.32175 type:complete len:499 (-) Transcript_9664:408-1904(-)